MAEKLPGPDAGKAAQPGPKGVSDAADMVLAALRPVLGAALEPEPAADGGSELQAVSATARLVTAVARTARWRRGRFTGWAPCPVRSRHCPGGALTGTRRPVCQARPVSTTPPGPEPIPTAPPVMPSSVRIGAIAMGVLAALLLTYAGLLWYSLDESVRQIADASKGITEDAARRFILTLLVPCLLLGILLALAAWFLPRRQAWARWLGLAASSLLALLMVFSTVAGEGISILPLLLFVLAAIAVRSLLLRSTGAWVASLRAGG
jgi:hypothetical protein